MANIFVFFRHATAAQHILGLDILRPLSPNGLEEAKNTAGFIESNGLKADKVFCSPAVRCQQTLAAATTMVPVTVSEVYAPIYLPEGAEIYEQCGNSPTAYRQHEKYENTGSLLKLAAEKIADEIGTHEGTYFICAHGSSFLPDVAHHLTGNEEVLNLEFPTAGCVIITMGQIVGKNF